MAPEHRLFPGNFLLRDSGGRLLVAGAWFSLHLLHPGFVYCVLWFQGSSCFMAIFCSGVCCAFISINFVTPGSRLCYRSRVKVFRGFCSRLCLALCRLVSCFMSPQLFLSVFCPYFLDPAQKLLVSLFVSLLFKALNIQFPRALCPWNCCSLIVLVFYHSTAAFAYFSVFVGHTVRKDFVLILILFLWHCFWFTDFHWFTILPTLF